MLSGISPLPNGIARVRAALALAAVLAGSRFAIAAPWQRAQSLGSPVAIHLGPADVRFLSSSAADVRLWDGRILLRAPGLDDSTLATIVPAIESRLREALDSWNVPFTKDDPIRMRIFSTDDPPSSEVFSLAGEGIADREPVVAMNIGGQTEAEVADEALRDVAVFVLRRLAPRAEEQLVFAAARSLALPEEPLDSDRDEIREAGASPLNGLERPESEVFAAGWIAEMSAAAGADFLRAAWNGRLGAGEASLASIGEAYREATGRSPAEALRRSLERTYSRTDVFGDLARLSENDRGSGALDASNPGGWAWRFFSVMPASRGGMRVSWPTDAAPGFAVLRYDEGLPSDVVRFVPGQARTLPLSGVSRIDWVIPGDGGKASALAAPVETGAIPGFPVSDLAARAFTEPGQGVSLEWNAERQQGLSGWAILRSEVEDSGAVRRTAPRWLPSQTGEQAQSLYSFVDPMAAAGRYYRYDVWAVTEDGALSRAFQVTIRAR